MRFVSALAVGLCGALAVCNPAAGLDFRVDNGVFVEGKATPASRSTTTFVNGLVFDRVDGASEWAVFDPAGKRFVLFDETRKIRTELTMPVIAEFAQQMDKKALATRDALIRFSASPEFDERFDKATGNLTMAGNVLTYRARLIAADKAAVAQYREFSDWFARLNLVLSPGSRPVRARLALNAAVEQRGCLPEEVAVEAYSSQSGKQSKVRSEHTWQMDLPAADAERLAAVLREAEGYRAVDLAAYRKAVR